MGGKNTRKWKSFRAFGGNENNRIFECPMEKMSILGLGRKLVPGVDYRGAGDAHTSLNLQWPGMLRKKEPDTGTKCRWKQVHCGI